MLYLKRGKDNPKEIVRKVQEIVEVVTDGIYGPATEAAVIDYQREHDLVVDGICGPETFIEMGINNDLADEQKTLSFEDKLHLVDVISRFEGNYWSCNKDWEFEGWFDRPKYDQTGKKLHPRERAEQHNHRPLSWSKYSNDPGHVGLSWGFVQFTQDGGNLGRVLAKMREADEDLFDEIFGEKGEELVLVTNRRGRKKKEKDSASPTGFARRSPRVQPVGGHDLWKDYWVERFERAGKEEIFQKMQQEAAIDLYFNSMIRKSAVPYNIHSEAGLTILLDRSIQLGPTGCRKLLDRYLRRKKHLPEYEMFRYLHHKIKDRRWAHRMHTLVYGDAVSFFKTFEEIK